VSVPRSADARPRVLIDAIAYSPRDGGFTSALHDLLDTCRGLPEFEFVVVHARRHAAVFQAYGLRTYSVALPRSLRFFASLVVMPLVARRTRAAAVHCEITALPWLMGIPGSVTVHDVYFLIEPQAGGRSIRQRIMSTYWGRVFVGSLRRARIVKAISETTAADLRRLVSPDLPIMVSEPRFAAPPGPEPVRSMPGPTQDLRLLFVGSVIPRKNLGFLVRSLLLVHRRWRLDIVGNLWWGAGELEPARDDERIHLHGYLADPERDQLMIDAHLLLAPSHYEGFGYPAAEAMVRGLPALTSDVGAFREFVPAEWRFPLDGGDTLASMIDSLDEAGYRDMPSIARAAVARFSPDAHRTSHRRLIGRLVATPPRQASVTSA
jgi:glycosyltransferase involved in cell wall biosynthesis